MPRSESRAISWSSTMSTSRTSPNVILTGDARAHEPRPAPGAGGDARRRRPGLVVRLHLPDGAPGAARAREEPRSEDLLQGRRLLGRPRRQHARAAQRSRGRHRLVRSRAGAVSERSGRARAHRVRRRDAGDPRGRHRRARRARSRPGRPRADRAALDQGARPRRAPQAPVRDRRLRARRRPRLRSRAGGHRAPRRPAALSPPFAAPPMIEVAGLRVVLPPAVVAVDGVDLTIRPGEFVVILGRSGAGKTTFLRALNRLVEPTAGVVRLGGRAVTGADAATLRGLRRQIGMVFQQFNLVRRASALVIVLVVLAWTAWDTGADPVRLGRGLPWLLDFVRRMLPPDLGVLPAALLGALK